MQKVPLSRRKSKIFTATHHCEVVQLQFFESGSRSLHWASKLGLCWMQRLFWIDVPRPTPCFENPSWFRGKSSFRHIKEVIESPGQPTGFKSVLDRRTTRWAPTALQRNAQGKNFGRCPQIGRLHFLALKSGQIYSSKLIFCVAQIWLILEEKSASSQLIWPVPYLLERICANMCKPVKVESGIALSLSTSECYLPLWRAGWPIHSFKKGGHPKHPFKKTAGMIGPLGLLVLTNHSSSQHLEIVRSTMRPSCSMVSSTAKPVLGELLACVRVLCPLHIQEEDSTS